VTAADRFSPRFSVTPEGRLRDARFETTIREAAGHEVTVGVVWLWCIAGSLAWWVLTAWAVGRFV
jgi:hypothetical protein